MKHLIKHLISHELSTIAARSLRNCHTKGVDSVVLVQRDGKCLVRLFVARPEHDLWMNDPLCGTPLSIALHPHHCDITLEVTSGLLYNHTAETGEYFGAHHRKVSQYLFRSAINSGEPATFERQGDVTASTIWTEAILDGNAVHMKARELHTVHVRRGETCAWFVYEGPEDPDYIPLCYTDNHALVSQPLSGLYEPMSESQVLDALILAKLA